MEKSYSESYAAAGVDITAGYRSVELTASFAFRASFRWHYSTLISVCGESDESSIHSHHLSNLICYLSFFHSFVHVFVILPE